MSTIPPVEPTEPSRDERPRPRYGEYAAPGAAPFVPPAPREHPDESALAASNFVEAERVFHNPPPANPKRLGVVAFVLGVILLAVSLVLAVVAGFAFGPLASEMITSNGTIDQTAITGDEPGVATFGVLSVAFVVLGTVLGAWAIVQGIIATVKKRGRAFGIVAIALAVATPVICFVVFYAVTFASTPEIFSSIG